MKCNKCGEECKENQAFCLKCGNPIQVVPDFNLIEAELASNIGELMDEETESEEKVEEEVISEIQPPDMELKLVDISRHSATDDSAEEKTKIIGDLTKLLGDEPEKEEESKEDVEANNLPTSEELEKRKVKAAKEAARKKKQQKKLIVAISAIVLVVVIAIVIFVIAAQSVEKQATSFDEYYKSAQTYYEKMNTEDALKDAENALDKADSKEEKMKARVLLNSIYVLAGEKNADYASNLEELVKLGTVDVQYYVALAEYYTEHKNYASLTQLGRSVDDKIILEAIADFIVADPIVDMEPGKYGTYIAVNLVAEEGMKIYYTIDGKNPSEYGKVFEEAVQIAAEGEIVLKAVAVNENGVESKIAEFVYNIELTGSGAPVVTPTGGAYTDYTKIKVEVPEGGKAYFTWDGTIPTAESQEYTEEIDMKRGINVLKVIIIDKYGITSEVTQESYNLQIGRVISLNEAVELVEMKVSEELEEGVTFTANYESLEIIDNDEYYIVVVSVADEQGNTTSVTYYAVNTYDKAIEKAVDEEGQFTILEEDSEENMEDEILQNPEENTEE